ncbi:hypothetical protein ACOI1H_13515 [Loktanella sp. DJP18]|uniref:hypothetical protein n=1 Tax=Loktanella sp. DJP18 TaxID=3409788 RepID=UPI003BB7B35C
MNRVLMMGGMMAALSMAGAAHAIAADVSDDYVKQRSQERTMRPLRDERPAHREKSDGLRRLLGNKGRA